VNVLQQRGATIYAEFLGGSFTCDAYHMTEPHPEGEMHILILLCSSIFLSKYNLCQHLDLSISGAGITLCIEKALADSGVTREEINYVNAHATSTQSGDLKEYEAIIRCFGQNPEVYIT
jgi:3-oxoacyl-[acyl-carrier-protein] synthase II